MSKLPPTTGCAGMSGERYFAPIIRPAPDIVKCRLMVLRNGFRPRRGLIHNRLPVYQVCPGPRPRVPTFCLSSGWGGRRCRIDRVTSRALVSISTVSNGRQQDLPTAGSPPAGMGCCRSLAMDDDERQVRLLETCAPWLNHARQQPAVLLGPS